MDIMMPQSAIRKSTPPAPVLLVVLNLGILTFSAMDSSYAYISPR